MSITLRQPLTLAECQLVREWRNDPLVLPMLRTGYKTEEEQAAFYRDVICHPGESQHHRYYALELDVEPSVMIGMGGLTYVHDAQAEISLILAPTIRGSGCGSAAVDALLAEAKRLGLYHVFGQCLAAGNLGFWGKQIMRRPALMEWTWTL